ncbi:hypothetical protein EVG20_g9845 [Dentipellis fragilis]|uniref:BTB domain-containing protein n=1 Tax=Dentipellis fragilis TaxID=205917 RepID=A0A4Y9XXE3_9AGAM|nr:hypothetical protein EVG20_g9845 [Dentipellis fragilis]
MSRTAAVNNTSNGKKRARDDTDAESVIPTPQEVVFTPGSEGSRTSASSSPRKRARVNAEVQTSPPRTAATAIALPPPTVADQLPIQACERRKDFWFADGDVVIRAENQLFKLNSEKMGIACNFFLSMFNDGHIGVGNGRPDGEDDEDHYQGMPLIHGTHTSLHEWELLIYVIYKMKAKLLMMSWDDIRTMLELSRKYESLPMREIAIRNMGFLYPTALPDFMMSTYLRKKYITGALPQSLHFQAYNLAVEFDLYQFLPGISYRISQYDFQQIIEGVRDTPDAEPHRLPAGAHTSILEGRESAREMRSGLIFKFMEEAWDEDEPSGPSGDKCLHQHPRVGPTCHQTISRLRCDWQKDGHVLRNTRHPLKMLGMSSRLAIRDMLCPPCRFAMKEEMSKGQAKLWVGLPTLFDLGTWFEIERKVKAKRLELAKMWSPDEEMLS